MKTEIDLKNEIERIKGIIEDIKEENEKIVGITWLKELNHKLIINYNTEVNILNWVLEG